MKKSTSNFNNVFSNYIHESTTKERVLVTWLKAWLDSGIIFKREILSYKIKSNSDFLKKKYVKIDN